tara:strand:+ start:883 stop:1344 length:462 start_codon:yes stop_codon:yes gene_type:complete
MIQVVIILVLLLGAGGFGGYTWIQKLQADNKVLQVNHAKLEGAVAEQEAVIGDLTRQAEAIQQANNDLRAQTNKLAADKTNLAKKLGKHELDILAQNKPVLVQRVINRASGRVKRCFEILTGSPLTEQEKNASKPSEFNSECPSIHPNYKENS